MMNLTTPALLFPATSLLLLAYTNRFLVLAQLIRNLQTQHKDDGRDLVIRQILNLRKRIVLTRYMQALGVSSFIMCAVSMFLIFVEHGHLAEAFFGISLFLLVLSLLVSLWEIMISTRAIEIGLEDMEQKLRQAAARRAAIADEKPVA
ncbi:MULTISPECIES: DUF2721 domain-containing protein [unclassified Herbaspirillum]|uniref:DUF2721 domain-containing protein n=1 Tax=unclassified Herbaspirillum TaxID=2624150 RepID=UPI00114D84D9|nr:MULTISPECIES: DUF2721 domain-containing protein [unclassified Herbaspirillum]MBB5391468.1 hypothetical protein [Herbaspirillum sp. SJZ102]TQK12847.1 uncharacterized protein DUF2721 [Herbaspirillum sp. SJZ130]TQK14851.1 uncharacterized protein DUF2721 [Herbaspirillum sp. SJZ106]TWC67206.1 uncharacterized protein DUF2721 [Herbaspirillum sp. SJZ099]